MNRSWEFPPPDSAVERERLRELKRLGLLDTPREEKFDRLMALASLATNSSAAWFCLIDESRQWFKSECGVDERETEREASLCAYTILDDGPMVIEDVANRDDISQHHPCMKANSRVGAYCGFPVRGTLRGTPIGTVGVFDEKPRKFTTPQIKALETIRDEVETQIALKMTRETIMNQKQSLQEVVGETEEMFKRLRSRVIDLAGALQSDAAFIERRSKNEILQDAAKDIVRGANTIGDIIDMAEGFVMWSTGQLKTLSNDLEKPKD